MQKEFLAKRIFIIIRINAKRRAKRIFRENLIAKFYFVVQYSGEIEVNGCLKIKSNFWSVEYIPAKNIKYFVMKSFNINFGNLYKNFACIKNE